tara:strand:- start:263 stop:751 length:489 start_codon:yes stop_codon:yes gene_type:complete
MIFSSIQLADAILWYNGMKKNNINYITTSFIIPLILSLQILYNVYIRNNNKNPFITLIVISVILSIFYKLNGYSKPSCNKLSSPVWGADPTYPPIFGESKEIPIWNIVVFCILILYPINNGNIVSVSVITLTSVIALMIGTGVGSLWCAMANIISLYYLYNY